MLVAVAVEAVLWRRMTTKAALCSDQSWQLQMTVEQHCQPARAAKTTKAGLLSDQSWQLQMTVE